MAPPLIQLKDIALTFGGTPLLSGVELSVSAGERVCLVGRNGSGKSTLLKIAAGLVEPDSGTPFVQPGATVRYLPQEPDFSGFATTLAYVEAGLGPGDDHLSGALSAGAARPARRRRPRASVRRRSPPRRAGAGAGAVARYPAARRADQPSRPHHHRMAGTRARQPPPRAGHHQPRPPLSLQPVALHRLARPRPDRGRSTAALPRSRTGATRCWPRKNATSTSSTARSSPRSTGCATASPAGASATSSALGNLHALREQRRDYRGAAGNASLAAADGG